MAHVLYRVIAELPCLAGLLIAGGLAYADKSAWIWSWFLVFAFANIITSNSTEKQILITTQSDGGMNGPAVPKFHD